ncbi:MAG TPA: AsmA family protein [Tepidisphaeraceae bacterium]|jgi:hypothetical protein
MPQDPAPNRKRRRWLIIAASAIIIVLFFILIIPTIASFSPVRSYVLSKINANLQAKLQIKSWSFGWISGFHANDITLQDKTGEILTVKHLSTGLTLRNLIKGNYKLGNVKVQDVHFNVVIDREGNSNLGQILKPTQTSNATAKSSPLPNVSGNITLSNVTGTITRVGAPTANITMQGTLKIPSINQPIENDLSVTLQSGSAAPGEVTAKGKISAIANNQVLDVAKMDIQENVALKEIDLAVLTPLLPTEQIDTVGGKANGNLTITKYPTRGIVADGQIEANKVLVRGAALKGDTYSSQQVLIRIPKVTIAPDGAVDLPEPMSVDFQQGRLTVAAKTSLAALENLAANRAPGESGFITADFRADGAALAHQLPHTLDLQPGLSLKTAQIAFAAKMNLSADHTAISQHLELSHISGTDDGQPIAFSPIMLDSAATVLPSNTPLPTLHDVSVKLASDFAAADFHGVSLDHFGGNAHADLAMAQRELSQLFDFHNWQLRGTIAATLSCQGDLTRPTTPLEITSRVQAENLDISGGVQPIREQSAIVDFSGKILRDHTGSIAGVDHFKMALQTNENGQTMTTLTANGSVQLNPGQASWHVIHSANLDVDLPDLPRTASLVEAIQSKGVRWTSGKGKAHIELAESNGSLAAQANITATDLAFARQSSTYQFDPMEFKGAGKLTDGELDVSALDGSLGNLGSVVLIKPVVLKTGSTPSAQGEIQVKTDLARANALAAAWNGTPTSQNLSGQAVLVQEFMTDGAKIVARGNGTISNLQVVENAQTQFHESSVKIVNDVSFDSAEQSLNFNSCSIAMESSHALDATLSGAIRHLSSTRDFDQVRVVVSYDLAALLKIITPMLPADEQQTLSQYAITGVQKHTIDITGSFPLGQSLDKSLKKVRVTGSIGLDRLEGNGITLVSVSPEFMLRDGVVTITGNGKTPAQLNGGTLNLVGVSCDLADPAERISTPPNLQLIAGTQLNAPMLGKFGSSLTPVLSNPTHAAGLLNISLVECSGFSVAQFTHPLAAGASPGDIKVSLSVGDVQIANNMAVVIGAFSPRSVLNKELDGNIDNAQFNIENGMIWSNLKFRIGQGLTLGFHGYVDVRTQELHKFILDFPTPLFGDITSLVHLDNVPTTIPIPITGTTSHYTLDLSGLNQLADAAKRGLEKGGKTVGNAVGKGINKAGGFFNKVFKHGDDGNN